MITTNLLTHTDAHDIVATKGRFSVLEYQRDVSVTPEAALLAYYAAKMNVKKRQVIAKLNGGDDGVILQSGGMQLMAGQVNVAANVKNPLDLVGKFVSSKVTGETTIKPRYVGEGIIVLEPTYRYVLLEDLDEWDGSMVIEDGMFLACDDSINLTVTPRTTVSSAVLGNEGLFNTTLKGSGIAVLESPVPQEELIEITLDDDVVRIDGDMAIAWSNTLQFTVERTTKTLVGSAASGEGLVNVFRGSGRVLIAPVSSNVGISAPKNTDAAQPAGPTPAPVH